MALIFTLGQLTTTWEVKLTNCDSNTPFETSDIDKVSIVFTKPDGTKLVKAATLIPDTTNPGEFLIQYRNIPPEESILDDSTSSWSYAGAGVLMDGGSFVTNEKQIFMVIS